MLHEHDQTKAAQFEAALNSLDDWTYAVTVHKNLGVISLDQGELARLAFRNPQAMREVATALLLAADRWEKGELFKE